MSNNNLAILGGQPILTRPFPAYYSLGEEEKNAVIEVMNKRIISDFLGNAGDKFLGGEYVRKFESEMRKYFNVEYAVSFNSATTALQAAVAALGIGFGDEVITSPFTMTATPSAILLNGAIPVFADIDDETFCLDADSIEKNITGRTKAILTVNIFGGASNLDKIIELARKYNLKVIEDNAQSIGAVYKNKFLGTIGDIGVFSFNVHKHLQCGEGGVLVTNDKKLAFRAQLVRNHGEGVVEDLCRQDENAFEPVIGSNYRLSELHAAVATEQLKKIDILTKPRIELADYLTEKLKNFFWLQVPKILENSTHVYYFYPFKFWGESAGFERSTFIKAMAAEGFPLRPGYTKPLYLTPLYQRKRMSPHNQFPFIFQGYETKINYNKGICPVAERLYEKELLLTNICQPPQTKGDIDLLIQAISKIDNQRKELALYEKEK